MYYISVFVRIVLAICWIQQTKCMNLGYNSESDIAQLLNNKAYIPNDKDLPKPLIVKASENDETHILSKLSDEELIKLLNEYPKRNEYVMDDIVKVSEDLRNNQGDQLEYDKDVQNEPRSAVFKLDNKEVDPFAMNKDGDSQYNALQKLNNMLYNRPRDDTSTENDAKKEMLFDILVAQLKTLCCKKNKPKKNKTAIPKQEKKIKKPTEYIFLVMNEEINSNTSDELIRVDPDSLSKNSSVLLLGPITTPLSDVQTKNVINRISKELSRPEYLPLLNKISEGDVDQKNSAILKSLITGPETRRYIKPHRCNHQSRLAKVYGGPKWLICTGYININTPSLYD